MSADGPVLAAGGVLWRGEPDAPEVALVHRPRYDDWSLPKGKLAPGEHALTAGVREVREETGASLVVGRWLARQRYQQRPGSSSDAQKCVDYWSMRADPAAAAFFPNDEIDQLLWLPPERAADQLSYPRDHRPLRRLLSLPLDLTPVLLVRHARAGHRSAWKGPDDQRPLDTQGQRQSMLLRDILALFNPTQVSSAPLLRCEQTLAPLAERLGAPTAAEPALTDAAAERDLDAGLQRIRAIARQAREAATGAVVCSQGGAIPAVVAELAREDRLLLPARSPRARKGSVWALFFDNKRCRDAFYLAAVEPPIPLTA